MSAAWQSGLEQALSADQIARLRVFEAAVRRWSTIKNLVSHQALDELWQRHILDSVQVQRAVPEASIWADLGSGGGFPGIVTAILLADRPQAIVHLIESDNRKCAFLRSVSRETGARTMVHHGRIETIVASLDQIQAVSARALAPLDQLVSWATPLLLRGAIGVFPKGRTVSDELTRLPREDRLTIELRPSLTQSDGALVIVRCNPPLEQISEKL
jgi:16S rRNA (guanine527-N7)-methyltransferase